MRKILMAICFCFLSFSFLSAEDLAENKNTFEYNFSLLESLTQADKKEELVEKIEKNLIKYPDFNAFSKNNLDKIIKYSFWKKVLIFSDKKFLKQVSENKAYSEKIRKFSLIQITDDLKKLDEIYHFFNKKNDNENKTYVKKQAMYLLFNQSKTYENFKKNLESFKYINALQAFDEIFPNHIFVLKLKEEVKKEQKIKQRKAEQDLNLEKKKKIYFYTGFGILGIIFCFITFKLFNAFFGSTKKINNNEKLSFNEILENAPEMELFREREEKISDLISNMPALKEALMPFAEDYKITFEDTVLISEFINSKSSVTVSGVEKLKELCADCKTGVVYSKKEDGFIVLCRKDIY
jgi:hypothetical protein